MTISRRPPHGRKVRTDNPNGIGNLNTGVVGKTRYSDSSMRRVTEWIWKNTRRGGRAKCE